MFDRLRRLFQQEQARTRRTTTTSSPSRRYTNRISPSGRRYRAPERRDPAFIIPIVEIPVPSLWSLKKRLDEIITPEVVIPDNEPAVRRLLEIELPDDWFAPDREPLPAPVPVDTPETLRPKPTIAPKRKKSPATSPAVVPQTQTVPATVPATSTTPIARARSLAIPQAPAVPGIGSAPVNVTAAIIGGIASLFPQRQTARTATQTATQALAVPQAALPMPTTNLASNYVPNRPIRNQCEEYCKQKRQRRKQCVRRERVYVAAHYRNKCSSSVEI